MGALVLLSVLGCASPFEGTWLFQADRQSQVTGDCADDSDTETVLTGTSNFWVDIFRTGSGEFVVLFDEPLTGDVSGNELTASWQTSEQSDDYTDSEQVAFTGALSGGTMTGNVTDKTTTKSGGDTYDCTTRVTFTAERNTSAPAAYPED
jgi:hypothetical protein